VSKRDAGQCFEWNALIQDRTKYVVYLTWFCHIPVTGSFAGVQIPDFHVSSGLQVSAVTVQLALNQMPIAAALLGNKPMNINYFVSCS
jgi:hypothetical protein